MLCVRNAPMQMPNVRTRLLPFSEMNLRFDENQDQSAAFEFDGYAVRWDSINSHGEKFVKGAFSDFIKAVQSGVMPCHMYYNHGYRLIWVNPVFAMRVGKWIELEEDDVGLRVRGRITPKHSLGNDVRAMLEDGTINGLSIGFYPPEKMDIEDKGQYIEIHRASLYEISVCDEPSDRDARVTDADIRTIETEDDLRNFLRQFNMDEATSNALIQRVQTLGKTNPEPKTDPFAWLDQV